MKPSRANEAGSSGWEMSRLSEKDERHSETIVSPDLSTSSDDVVDRLASALSTALRNLPSTPAGRPSMTRGDVVPPFNPKDVNQDINAWCVKVDESRNMFGWSEEITIFNAISKLEGLASVWYKGLRSINFTWEEWKQKLRRAFPSQRDYHDLLEEMMKRKKKFDETFSQYFYEKQALLNACNITGREAVSCIIGGILDTQIRIGAKAANCSDPESLFEYLRNLNDDSTIKFKPPFKKNFDQNLTRKRKFIVGKNVNKIYCHNCEKYGHLRRDCPNNKTDNNRGRETSGECYLCRETGHYARFCPKRRKYHETK